MSSQRTLVPGWACGLAGISILLTFILLAAACGTGAPGPPSRPSRATARRPTGFEPAAASFVSPDRGWVLGHAGCPDCAGLRVTRDGGAHWTALPAPPAPLGYYTNSATAVTDVAFADGANGFLYGPDLLATHDSGRSWTRQPLPPVQQLSIGTRYAYALTQTQPGAAPRLWRSVIGSRRWTRLPLPPGARPPSPESGPAMLLYVEGGTVVLLRQGLFGPAITPGQAVQLWASRDDATRWQARPVPCSPPRDGGAAVLSIVPDRPESWLLDCFSNQQSSQEQDTQHHLYGSTDAGRSWVRLPDPTRHNVPALLAANGQGHAFLATEGSGTPSSEPSATAGTGEPCSPPAACSTDGPTCASSLPQPGSSSLPPTTRQNTSTGPTTGAVPGRSCSPNSHGDAGNPAARQQQPTPIAADNSRTSASSR